MLQLIAFLLLSISFSARAAESSVELFEKLKELEMLSDADDADIAVFRKLSAQQKNPLPNIRFQFLADLHLPARLSYLQNGHFINESQINPSLPYAILSMEEWLVSDEVSTSRPMFFYASHKLRGYLIAKSWDIKDNGNLSVGYEVILRAGKKIRLKNGVTHQQAGQRVLRIEMQSPGGQTMSPRDLEETFRNLIVFPRLVPTA